MRIGIKRKHKNIFKIYRMIYETVYIYETNGVVGAEVIQKI